MLCLKFWFCCLSVAALTQHKVHAPDIIFLDLEMPDLNGYDVLKELHGIPKFSGVPVVAYTSHTSEMGFAREAGFHSFLGKPLNSGAFGDQVASIINDRPVWEVRD